jgi:hypothetical protein
MFRSLITIAILVLLIGMAGLFYMAPKLAFYDMRSAAESGDVQSLAKLIDFDKVRASLKGQLNTAPDSPKSPSPSVLSDPIGAAGRVITDTARSIGKSIGQTVETVLDPNAPKPKPVVDVESYLTPNAILGITYGAGHNAPDFDRDAAPTKAPDPERTFFSISHARMTIADTSGTKTRLTYSRSGLFDWRLVHIGLPGTEEPKDEKSKPAESATNQPAQSPKKEMSMAE